MKNITDEFIRVYKNRSENIIKSDELQKRLAKLKKTREKYMDMYVDGIISRDELNNKTKTVTNDISLVEDELKAAEYNLNMEANLERLIKEVFTQIEDIVSVEEMTNEQLKKIIEKMIVYPDGTVDIHLKLLSDMGMRQNILFS